MGDRAEDESESARVARVLREQIVDGVRAPGSRLVERDLAAELGISRVPVREALHTLAGEGLAVPRRNTWMTVRSFTNRDIAELNEVRLAFEPLTVRRAAELRDRNALRRMKRSLDLQGRATARGDATTARRAAADFHEAMIEAGGNSLLAEISTSLAGRMRWLLGQYDDLEPVYEEHRELYLAIEAGDARTAAALARRHLRLAMARTRKPGRGRS
ncbi:GntR family transcriptional regulator [Actinopolymorpha sp. NPDC004070]|uniref:GntR family transcriptional regulator n=1 Tax=Actinopolymorpha sp. NPDC004070 TaxID=3154548 RepID=UPI0033B64E23